MSLGPRSLACSSRSWCPRRARGLVEAPSPRQGFWAPGPPFRVCHQEPDGSPTFPRSPSEDMPRSSGRNTARATLGREFPTCTFSVCAAGSSFRHSSRFRKPPSHPGRSDCPSPVGSQRSACVISAKPSPIDRGFSARPHTPLIRMVYFAESPRLRLPQSQAPSPALVSSLRAIAVPRAPSPLPGVTPRSVPLPATSIDVPRSSALVRAHAPRQNPPVASVCRLGPRVLAGCCVPLLGVGPSRRYLLTLSLGAWTRTPPRFSGALARFFPDNSDLTSVYTGSARWNLHHQSNFSDGHLFRGCSHSLMFRLPYVLGLQVAPTSLAPVALQMLPVRRFVVSSTSRSATLKHRP